MNIWLNTWRRKYVTPEYPLTSSLWQAFLGNTLISFKLKTQYSTAQYITVQYSTVQYSTVQHSTAQHSTGQHSTAQYITVQHSTAQHSTAQYSTAQHSTSQYSTAQYSRVHHITAQHRPVDDDDDDDDNGDDADATDDDDDDDDTTTITTTSTITTFRMTRFLVNELSEKWKNIPDSERHVNIWLNTWRRKYVTPEYPLTSSLWQAFLGDMVISFKLKTNTTNVNDI